jgi:hypothetical protein
MVQQITAVNKAEAVLLILMGCSSAMARYPTTKMRIINNSIFLGFFGDELGLI